MTDLHVTRTQQHQRNLNVARSRALVIHHEKEVTSKILDYVEALCDSPAGSSPARHEAEQLLAATAIFCPHDFDDLTIERGAQSLCGHALCSNPPRSAIAGKRDLQKLLLDSSGEAEKWCSDLCMQKSLWLRQQLPSKPAWERQHQPTVKLHPLERGLLMDDLDKVREGVSAIKLHEASDLAQERGDPAVSWKPGHVMTDSLVEKAVVSKPKPPVLPLADEHSAEMDGYVPRQLDGTLLHLPQAHAGSLPPAPRQQDEIDVEQSWNDMLEQLGDSNQPAVH